MNCYFIKNQYYLLHCKLFVKFKYSSNYIQKIYLKQRNNFSFYGMIIFGVGRSYELNIWYGTHRIKQLGYVNVKQHTNNGIASEIEILMTL